MKLLTKNGWTATSSGIYEFQKDPSIYYVSNLIDGNQHSYYSSKNTKKYHWFQIDFGRIISVMKWD